MTHLVTYRDISENLSETFRKHRKEQGGFCGWSGNEFEDIQKGFQLAAQESKESLRIRKVYKNTQIRALILLKNEINRKIWLEILT